MLVLVLLTGLDWSSAILKLPTNAVRVGPWERSEESGSKPTEEGGGGEILELGPHAKARANTPRQQQAGAKCRYTSADSHRGRQRQLPPFF